jgi:hypothetical protein
LGAGKSRDINENDLALEDISSVSAISTAFLVSILGNIVPPASFVLR